MTPAVEFAPELGARRAECRIHPHAFRDFQKLIVLVMFIGVFVMAYFIYLAIVTTDSVATYLYSGFSLLILLFLFYLYRQLQISRTLRIFLYDHGFVYLRLAQKHVVPWNDVTTVKMNITEIYRHRMRSDIKHSFTLFRKDGAPISFTLSEYTFLSVKQLSNIIQQEVMQRLLPKAIMSFADGQTIQFGRLAISQSGIGSGKETLPWSEIKAVRLNHGKLIVRRQDAPKNWASIAINQIPNVFVFLALADLALKQQVTTKTT